MIDDMEYHVVAWSDILNNDLKAGLSYNEVKSQMYGKTMKYLPEFLAKAIFRHSRCVSFRLKKSVVINAHTCPN